MAVISLVLFPYLSYRSYLSQFPYFVKIYICAIVSLSRCTRSHVSYNFYISLGNIMITYIPALHYLCSCLHFSCVFPHFSLSNKMQCAASMKITEMESVTNKGLKIYLETLWIENPRKIIQLLVL